MIKLQGFFLLLCLFIFDFSSCIWGSETCADFETACCFPFIKLYDAPVDRDKELGRCRYLTGEQLAQDWPFYASGNRNWIHQSRYIVLDVEVNSPSYEGEIIQISALEFINGRATGRTFNTFVNPTSDNWSAYSARVHGITRAELRDQPTFKDIAEDLVHFIGGSLVIAHNAAFDVRMLAQEYERLEDLEPFDMFYKCSMYMHRRDEKREDSGENLMTSPLKVKTMAFVSPEEIQMRNSQKRAAAHKAKERRSQRSASGGPKRKRETTSGLGHFIAENALTYEGAKVRLELTSPQLKKPRQIRPVRQHHDALFDAMGAGIKVHSFSEKSYMNGTFGEATLHEEGRISSGDEGETEGEKKRSLSSRRLNKRKRGEPPHKETSRKRTATARQLFS